MGCTDARTTTYSMPPFSVIDFDSADPTSLLISIQTVLLTRGLARIAGASHCFINGEPGEYAVSMVLANANSIFPMTASREGLRAKASVANSDTHDHSTIGTSANHLMGTVLRYYSIYSGWFRRMLPAPSGMRRGRGSTDAHVRRMSRTCAAIPYYRTAPDGRQLNRLRPLGAFWAFRHSRLRRGFREESAQSAVPGRIHHAIDTAVIPGGWNRYSHQFGLRQCHAKRRTSLRLHDDCERETHVCRVARR